MSDTLDDSDDSTISDAAVLWRRVPPWHVVLDENAGRLRPKSAAFDDHPDGSAMSVVIAERAEASGRGPDEILAGHAEFALAAITGGLARAHGLRIVRKPLPEEPAHAEVFGRKTKAVKKALARNAEWIVPPRGPASDSLG